MSVQMSASRTNAVLLSGGQHQSQQQHQRTHLLTTNNNTTLANIVLTSPITIPGTPCPSKGLLNGPGQNNCFLNCAVQVRIVLFYVLYN